MLLSGNLKETDAQNYKKIEKISSRTPSAMQRGTYLQTSIIKKHVNKSSIGNQQNNNKPLMFYYAKNKIKERLKKSPETKATFKALLKELLKDIDSYKRSRVNGTIDDPLLNKKDYIIELDEDGDGDSDDNNNDDNNDNEDTEEFTDSDKDEDDDRFAGHRRSRTGGQFSTLISLLQQFIGKNKQHRIPQKVSRLTDDSREFDDIDNIKGVSLLRQFLNMNRRRRMREYRLAENSYDADDDENTSLVRQFIRMNKHHRPVQEVRLVDDTNISDDDGRDSEGSFERRVVTEPYNTNQEFLSSDRQLGQDLVTSPLNSRKVVSVPYVTSQESLTGDRRNTRQSLLMVPLTNQQFIREPYNTNQNFITGDRPYIAQNILNSRQTVSTPYFTNQNFFAGDRRQSGHNLVLAPLNPEPVLQPIYANDINGVIDSNNVDNSIGRSFLNQNEQNEFLPFQNIQWRSFAPVRMQPTTTPLQRLGPFGGNLVGNTRDFLGNRNQLYVLEKKRRKRRK